MKTFLKVFSATLLIVLTPLSFASERANVWGQIPFQRGPDLCGYRQAFTQDRVSYMGEMVGLANSLMQSGAYGDEAEKMLKRFDALYDKHKNAAIADSELYLSIELENSLKAYLDQFYRELPIQARKIVFYHSTELNEEKVNYVALGSYAFAPQCQGKIKVSVSMIDDQGLTQTFQSIGEPQTVMYSIAVDMFREFQKTKFYGSLQTSSGKLELVPSNNGELGKVRRMEQAKRQCEMNGARLPNAEELEDIDSYGAWNGGVSLERDVWVIEQPEGLRLYAAFLQPLPIKVPFDVNQREYSFYCVR